LRYRRQLVLKDVFHGQRIDGPDAG
jgi:hypothetical protein